MRAERVGLRPRTLISARQWLLCVVVLHAVGWVSMLSGSSRAWTGSWKMAYDWASGSLLLVGPVGAGVAAVVYARIRRSSVADLIRAGVSAYAWAVPLLKVWLAVVLSTALLAAEVSVALVTRGIPVVPAQFLNVPYLLALSLAHVSWGAVLGLLLREMWAGACAVVVSFLAFLLAATGLLPRVFMPGSITGTLVGQVYRPAAMALLFICAGGMVVAGLAVLHAYFGAPRGVMGGIAAAGLATLLLVGAVPGQDLEGRLTFAHVDYVCRGGAPSLCMARETPLLAGEGAAALRRLGRPLVESGAALPDRWVQYTFRDPPRDAGEFLVADDAESTGRLTDGDVIVSLTYPAGCDEELEPARSLNARGLLGAWIALRNELPYGAGHGTRFVAWARSERSDPWVRSTYRKLRECRLHAITRPPGLP